MTTITIPAPPTPMPSLSVDASAIDECGAQLLAASAQIDDLGSFIAGPARVPSWHGDASVSYHDVIRPMGRGADAMSLALRSVARRVDVHAERMDDLDQRHTDLDDRCHGLAWGIDTLRDDIERVGSEPGMASVMQGRADNIAQSIREYHRDRSAWITELGVEEQAMAAAFRRLMTLDQVERHYGGVEDPADDALATIPPSGSSPDEVHAWWLGLTRAQRQAIIAASPGSIGNLDGIPAGARNEANTVRLDRDLADLRSLDPDVMTDEEERRLENAEAAATARDQIESEIDPVTGEPVEAQIYIYDPDAFGGDGRIAIAAGDLDTADNVTVVVPGLTTDATSAPDQAGRASDIYGTARSLDPSQTNATMFWIGYDAPDNIPIVDGLSGDFGGVATEGLAEDGGHLLSDTVDGLRASRDDDAHLTVVGHSYGSTTVGHSATDDGLAADDIVLVGSPGPGGDADHASDLGVGSDHVFVGANSHDLVANLGDDGTVNLGNLGGAGLGRDPAEDDFGAIRFQAESTTRGDGLNPLADHSKYFDPDTESLYNIGQVVNGNYDGVQQAGHIHDPWWRGPQDPEYDRDPTSPSTHR